MSIVTSQGMKGLSGECVNSAVWIVRAFLVSPFTLHPSPFTYETGLASALS